MPLDPYDQYQREIEDYILENTKHALNLQKRKRNLTRYKKEFKKQDNVQNYLRQVQQFKAGGGLPKDPYGQNYGYIDDPNPQEKEGTQFVGSGRYVFNAPPVPFEQVTGRRPGIVNVQRKSKSEMLKERYTKNVYKDALQAQKAEKQTKESYDKLQEMLKQPYFSQRDAVKLLREYQKNKSTFDRYKSTSGEEQKVFYYDKTNNKILDAETGEKVTRLPKNAKLVNMDETQQSQKIFVENKETGKLFDPQTGKEVFDIPKNSKIISKAQEPAEIKKQKQKTSELKNLLNTVETEFAKTSPGSGVFGTITGYYSKIASKIGATEQQQIDRAYDSSTPLLATKIARAMGEVGTMTDYDINRALNAIPRLTDNREVAKFKINILKTFMQNLEMGNIEEAKRGLEQIDTLSNNQLPTQTETNQPSGTILDQYAAGLGY